MKTRFVFLFIILLTVSVVGHGSGEDTLRQDKDQRYREVRSQIKLLWDVYSEVNKRYVDDVNLEEFIKAGINGMLETLDPYTVFFEPEQADDLEILTTGQYGGVGIEIGLRGRDKELTVISPIEDTPSSRKGMQSGDVIIAVDGKSTKGFSTSEAAKHIRGEAGTDVTLTIRRSGYDKPLDYTLTRENIVIHDVAYAGMLDDGIGYIKLIRFSGRADFELRKALDDVMSQNPEGLVLDLRSNPGGLLPSAVAVAGQFLKQSDPIVKTQGRFHNSDREFKATGKPLASDVPLVVLVNGGSASASEIVAGAIQDLDRGVIVGTTSFGKGLVQTVVHLKEKSALKVTTARYYTPSGRLIQRDRSKDHEPTLSSSDPMGSTTLPDSIASDVESAAERYFTRNGREVTGGGGITPDIIIKLDPIDPVGVEMYRRDLFFTFMSEYFQDHERPDTVDITEIMIDNFEQFIDSIDFTPHIPGAEQLEALREIGDNDSLGSDFFDKIKQIEGMLSAQVSVENPKLREFIRESLDREMASSYGGREWRIRSTFNEDIQLSEAIRILKNADRYNMLLQGSGRADAGDTDN